VPSVAIHSLIRVNAGAVEPSSGFPRCDGDALSPTTPKDRLQEEIGAPTWRNDPEALRRCRGQLPAAAFLISGSVKDGALSDPIMKASGMRGLIRASVATNLYADRAPELRQKARQKRNQTAFTAICVGDRMVRAREWPFGFMPKGQIGCSSKNRQVDVRGFEPQTHTSGSACWHGNDREVLVERVE